MYLMINSIKENIVKVKWGAISTLIPGMGAICPHMYILRLVLGWRGVANVQGDKFMYVTHVHI